MDISFGLRPTHCCPGSEWPLCTLLVAPEAVTSGRQGTGVLPQSPGLQMCLGYGVYVEPVAVQHVCAHVPVADDESEGRRRARHWVSVMPKETRPLPSGGSHPARETKE